jgi:anaphase-promoting complex subunit 11
MRITVKHFHAISVWQWDTSDDQCAICYQPFDMCCESCKVPGESCPPAWGECSHQYHSHCIERWLSNNNKNCPMCRREFKEVKRERSPQPPEQMETESDWPSIR